MQIWRLLFCETLYQVFLIYLLFSISYTAFLSVSRLPRCKSSPRPAKVIFEENYSLYINAFPFRPRHEMTEVLVDVTAYVFS